MVGLFALKKSISKFGKGKHYENVTVHKKGKTFTQKRLVGGGNDSQKSVGSNVQIRLDPKGSGFYQKQTSAGWVNLTKDKAKADKYASNRAATSGAGFKGEGKKSSPSVSGKVSSFTKRPHVKEGAMVRISAGASNVGKGIVGKIHEIGDNFVRIMDEAGNIFRVQQHQLAMAKSRQSLKAYVLKKILQRKDVD